VVAAGEEAKDALLGATAATTAAVDALGMVVAAGEEAKDALLGATAATRADGGAPPRRST
jgi:hypothetical protein